MFLQIYIFLLLGCASTFTFVSSSSMSISQTIVVPLIPSQILEVIEKRWSEAKSMATLEQEVEDWNAQFVAAAGGAAQASTRRRLICQPLEEETFDPPMGAFSRGHCQTGDKMSLPKVFWQAIQLNHAQVPWLFQVSRIEGVTSERHHHNMTEEALVYETLDRVVGGPLDFRAPGNFIFLPWWMMRALGLQPRDVVDVQLIQTVPAGSLAKLRPHSSEFSKIANPQAVMETELRHYSALTKGSTIAFDYNQKRYWFDVVETRSAPRGEKQPMIKVQDCDIATDFLTPKDVLKKKKEKKESKD
jgi:hypothetical protein